MFNGHFLILFNDLVNSVLHGKSLIAAYAGRMTVAQFEAKCQGSIFMNVL